jgi:hypothetical protein
LLLLHVLLFVCNTWQLAVEYHKRFNPLHVYDILLLLLW